MKKGILLALTVLLSGFNSYAQSSTTKYRGASEGRNRPWIMVTPAGGAYQGTFQKDITSEGVSQQSFQAETQATAGVLIDYNSHRAGFALQTGLVMNQSKAVYSASQNNIQATTSFEDQYLSVPLAVKFYPFTSAARWLYFRFGANVSYLMESKNVITVSQNSQLSAASTQTAELDIIDKRERIDLQAIAGAGIILPITKSFGITLEGNYYHGFINTDKSPEAVRQDLYTKGMSGMLGISFAL